MVETALFSLQDAAVLCDGRYMGPSRVLPCREVCIESRNIRGEELFIPLKGERTDGHRYIRQALAMGAAGALCGRAYYEDHKEELRNDIGDRAGIIIVEDTLKAFWELSEGYLERFPRLTRIGVTGSSGKTTTKEILGSIFSPLSSTLINEGNLNSETGLPLSVLNVRSEHRFGIFEMGINHPGEMEVLARIVKPRAAVITNIGTAHIGLLGSREAIAREKRGIFSYLGTDGAAFIPEDEPHADILTEGTEAHVIRFGRRSTEGFAEAMNLGLHGWEVRLFNRPVHFPLIGEFNLRNALCAVTVARYFDIDEMAVCSGLEQVEPLFGRGQILYGRSTVLHDCYNANPHSLLEALMFMDGLAWTGRKIAVLGAMKELGEETESSHALIVRRAVSSGIDMIFLVGLEYRDVFKNVRDEVGDKIEWFDGVEDLIPRIRNTVRSGDLVLVKGSRDMALERITNFIV